MISVSSAELMKASIFAMRRSELHLLLSVVCGCDALKALLLNRITIHHITLSVADVAGGSDTTRPILRDQIHAKYLLQVATTNFLTSLWKCQDGSEL